jgi:t-SNARE complex subunit (syntaxin)
MACREVSTWITENVLVPVERVITEAREACENVRKWFCWLVTTVVRVVILVLVTIGKWVTYLA